MPVLPWGIKPGTGSGGSGTVTSVSVVTANGISGSVATSTTTPAITLTLGAITPTTVNSVTISGSSTPALAVTGTSSISGSNTGDQTITLTGVVTGSGTGSLATSIQSSIALPGSPTTTTQASTDNSTKIATTAYVTTGISNAIAGVNPAIAVQAATTANVTGYTYNNGASGIGATLTQNSAAVVVIDGYTLLLNDRVLFKNQSTAADNGIYSITTLGTGVVPAVFTRATDYNQSSDINNTGAIPVVNGTVNALTSWLLTSAVTTIGTDSLTYTQFSYSPTAIIPPNLGGTGIANNVASTLTISGNFATTLTVSAATGVTLPTSGTLYGTKSGSITSSQLATSLTDETGSGAAVFANTPTLVTPTLGAATATSINGLTITTSTGTLTVTNAKTLSISNSLTLAGTDSTTMTFPSTSATIARTDAAQTFTGIQTLSSAPVLSSGTITGSSSNLLTLPTSADTLVGRATTDTLTNKTLTNPVISQFSTASGLGASWIDYSSSVTFANFTIGNGTVICRYMQIGKIVHYRGEVTLGSTSSMGSGPTVSLPIATSATGYSANSGNTSDILGVGSYTRNSVAGFPVNYTWASTTTVGILALGAAGTYTNLVTIAATVPATWANLDTFTWNIAYEAA